ncbi:MAG: M81 family metallopeptidase, partial [Bacteroidales bacterium]|nr:M81 family metallopeptidase [Bacteroidales bacterium]
MSFKQILAASIILTSLLGCQSQQEKPTNKPRIAIAGLAIECSTFSPAQTGVEDFRARRGEEIYSYYPFLHEDSATRQRAQYFPALRGHAIPGGIVTRAAYDTLMTQMLNRLRENLPYDGVFFDIHGAMSVVGLDDPEG